MYSIRYKDPKTCNNIIYKENEDCRTVILHSKLHTTTKPRIRLRVCVYLRMILIPHLEIISCVVVSWMSRWSTSIIDVVSGMGNDRRLYVNNFSIFRSLLFILKMYDDVRNCICNKLYEINYSNKQITSVMRLKDDF